MDEFSHEAEEVTLSHGTFLMHLSQVFDQGFLFQAWECDSHGGGVEDASQQFHASGRGDTLFWANWNVAFLTHGEERCVGVLALVGAGPSQEVVVVQVVVDMREAGVVASDGGYDISQVIEDRARTAEPEGKSEIRVIEAVPLVSQDPALVCPDGYYAEGVPKVDLGHDNSMGTDLVDFFNGVVQGAILDGAFLFVDVVVYTCSGGLREIKE